MKITTEFWADDDYDDAVYDAVTESMKDLEGKLSVNEYDVEHRRRCAALEESLGRWVKDGNSVRVEFDTAAGTAVVVSALQ